MSEDSLSPTRLWSRWRWRRVSARSSLGGQAPPHTRSGAGTGLEASDELLCLHLCCLLSWRALLSPWRWRGHRVGGPPPSPWQHSRLTQAELTHLETSLSSCWGLLEGLTSDPEESSGASSARARAHAHAHALLILVWTGVTVKS